MAQKTNKSAAALSRRVEKLQIVFMISSDFRKIARFLNP